MSFRPIEKHQDILLRCTPKGIIALPPNAMLNEAGMSPLSV